MTRPPDAVLFPEPLAGRIAKALGAEIVHAEAIGGGYTPARRLRVGLSDGRTAFVKAATNENTLLWLRQEARVYAALEGAPFLVQRLAWEDHEQEPFLILEDLSDAHWPPPWNAEQIDAVLRSLEEIHAALPRIPFPLLSIETDKDFASWHLVAKSPEAFLSLGLCSPQWLDAALPTLIAAEAAAPLAGNDLLHMDVRSDNICFAPDGRTLFVDWNWTCRGNGDLDIAAWLPSLHAEGGPSPESILSDAGRFAALLSGFWAYRAGTPPPPGAPRVREVQRQQLSTALPWTIRALNLPSPDQT